MTQVSVIVPIGPFESHWVRLVESLTKLPAGQEVVLVGVVPTPPTFYEVEKSLQHLHCKWIQSDPGRAKQMNLGAQKAFGKCLWFVHADSILSEALIGRMWAAVQRPQRGVYFFRLLFLKDGPSLTVLNQMGVWARSRLLKIPFGDQGFLMRKDLFFDLGSYREDAPFGEDHLLTWQAKRFGVPLIYCGTPIYTSARAYREKGWLPTTLKYFFLTLGQAIPEWLSWKLRFRRIW